MSLKLGKREIFQKSNELWVIPDIHGSLDKLESLWSKVKLELKPEDHVVFLGDYIGKFSRKNLKTIIKLQSIANEHKNVYFIKGNHEESLLDWLRVPNKNFFLDKEAIEEEFLFMGYPSLKKTDFINWLKSRNIDFLFNCIPYYESEDVIISHAPFCHRDMRFRDIEEGLLDSMEINLMWDFVDESDESISIKGIDKWLICGHQNNRSKRLFPSIYEEAKRIFMDCGVGYSEESVLYCLGVYSRKLIDSK